MPITDAEVGRLLSDVEHIKKGIDSLWDAIERPIRDNEELRRDTEEVRRQNIAMSGDVGRLTGDLKEIKEMIKKVSETMVDWHDDISYIREMRETKNKIKVNVISQWIVGGVSILLWLYTMFGAKMGKG